MFIAPQIKNKDGINGKFLADIFIEIGMNGIWLNISSIFI